MVCKVAVSTNPGRPMQIERPDFVGDAIHIAPNGLHVGHYGPYRLYSAYQPIYAECAGSNPQLAAFEGLIRPRFDGQDVRPAEFFAGVIRRDHLFVERMCRALHLRNYKHVRPSGKTTFFNVDAARYGSMWDLEHSYRYFIDRFEEHGMARGNVVVEILESKPTEPGMLEWLRDFSRDQNIKIAIDDFGQLHSDLDRYYLLQPDIVKIDCLLFQEGYREPAVRKLLASTIERFHGNGSIVLIEGIESASQLDAALAMGADLIQGFLLARPSVLPHAFDVAEPRPAMADAELARQSA